MKVRVRYKGRNIKLEAKETNFLTRASGLMLKPRKTQNLFFTFNIEKRRAIHSFFVFFSFLAIWLDKKNKIIELRIVKPFEFSVRPKRKFMKLIELPVNATNSQIIAFFVGKEKSLNR